MPAFIDITGQRFGAWTVLHRTVSQAKNHHGVTWTCRCDCGRVGEVRGAELRRGSSNSCQSCARKRAAESLRVHFRKRLTAERTSTSFRHCEVASAHELLRRIVFGGDVSVMARSKEVRSLLTRFAKMHNRIDQKLFRSNEAAE
jgi:hypothetical protein